MLPFFMFTLSLEGFRPRPALPHPSEIPRQNRPAWASHLTFHFRPSTSFFSYYYALFCAAQNPNSFRFIFFRTLCTKHPGWVSHLSNERVRSVPGSFSDHDSPNTDRNSHPLLVTRHSAPVAASALFLPSVTSHQSQFTKSFIIRIYEKRARNSFRIRTYKTRHLKPFRINTYKKNRGGVPTLRFAFTTRTFPRIRRAGSS
jgi:hypothetical protein